MIRCLAVTGVFLHFGKALFAAFTAALNSSLVVRGTLETTSCVAYHYEQKSIDLINNINGTAEQLFSGSIKGFRIILGL